MHRPLEVQVADGDAPSGRGQERKGQAALVARLRPTTWSARLLATGLLAALTLAVLLPLLAVDAFSGVRLSTLDRFYPAGAASDRVLVVELDIIGMDRVDHAAVVRTLAEGGADAILYDVVFDLEGDDPAGDAALAAAIADAGNVVLASATRLELDRDARLLMVETAQPPIEPLADAARAVASASIWTDPEDGVVRTVPIAVDDGRRFIPSLSAAAVAVADGADPELVTVRPEGVEVGGRYHLSPPEAHGLMTISWAPGLKYRDPAAPAVPGAAVLAGDVPPATFDGKVVLVGDTDDNLALDYHLTPVAKGGGMPGVWAQANAVNTMLTSQYRTSIRTADTIALMAVLSMVTALAALGLRIRWIGFAVVGIAALLLIGVDFRFQNGVDTGLVFPTLAILFTSFSAVALRYVTEVRDRRRVAELFGKYIPPAVAQELVESGRLEAAAAGERLEISTWFADLRGFTATAATLDPSQVRELLDVYYEYTTEIIQDHGGTVMQYVGDEVFAIFGAPVKHPDHSQRAVDAAIAVRDAITEINADLDRRGLPPIQYGIGVNSGSVVAGHVGTYHKQYSVIGDTVNVGSRLCSLAKAGHVTFPEEVRVRLERCPEIEAYGPVYMKGVERDVDVHVARRADSEKASHEESVKAGPKPA